MSQQNSVKHVLTSAAGWELTQVADWADCCNRWSYWNGILPGLTGRNQRVTGIPPFPSRCVVGSGPRHCIYILCMLRCCLLEIVNSGGMLSGHRWAPGPPGKCAHCDGMTLFPLLQCGNVQFGPCSCYRPSHGASTRRNDHLRLSSALEAAENSGIVLLVSGLFCFSLFLCQLKISLSVYPSATSASQQYKWSWMVLASGV